MQILHPRLITYRLCLVLFTVKLMANIRQHFVSQEPFSAAELNVTNSQELSLALFQTRTRQHQLIDERHYSLKKKCRKYFPYKIKMISKMHKMNNKVFYINHIYSCPHNVHSQLVTTSNRKQLTNIQSRWTSLQGCPTR